MIYNYLKTALRNLLRHRFFSFINIFGLAVAMSICMAMIMLVGDQLSYDRYNTNASRIYRVTTIDVDVNGKILWENQLNAASTMPLAAELMQNYTNVEKAVRLRRGFGNGWLEIEGQNINVPLAGFFADPEVLTFFQYELQTGNAATALKDPFTVVLTQTAAHKLFANENPIGKTIDMGDLGSYTVTGVLKETDHKSHIVFEGLASMASATSLEASGKFNKSSENWSDFWSGWTYVMVTEGTTRDDLQASLDKVYDQRIYPTTGPGTYRMMLGLQHLLSITPGDIMSNGIGPELPWGFVYFLGGLALVILITSCFNFTNLSIARSLTRAREIGVRKVSGATRLQVFTQFLAESIVISFAALLVAVTLLFIIKPMLLQLSFAQAFRWDMYDGAIVYAIFLAFAIVVGIFAGLFPAVVLSGFQPIKVLKNLNNIKLFSRMGLRKTLLVSQFTLSLFFIVTVLVIHDQLRLFTTQDHGFNMKNNILVKLNGTTYQSLKTELQKYGNIQAVSAVSHLPAANVSYGCGIKLKPEDTHVDAGYFFVDEDYADNMQLKFLAGGFFKAEHVASNKNFIVLNEAAVNKLQFKIPQEAIGEVIIYSHDSVARTIIGVVANYNHRDLTREISPMILLYDPQAASAMQVSYAGPYQDAAASLEKAWTVINPEMKIDYISVESEINKLYELVFGDLVNVLGFVSFLAILISCLGLLGMATYATETRIKEISIRKVLGSTNAGLVMLLSKGFVAMLTLSVAIGVLLAWFVNDLWLSQIAYRTTIGLATIGIGVLVLILFGAITIGSQTLRAAFVNPAENLKTE